MYLDVISWEARRGERRGHMLGVAQAKNEGRAVAAYLGKC